MNWTKERKLYVGVLAAGLAALVTDRLTGGGQSADPPPDEPASALVVKSTPQTAPAAAAAPAPPAAARKLSERLTAWAANAPRKPRDPFVPAAAWSGVADVDAIPPSAGPERFRQNHRLTAVLMSGRQSQAIIDGTPIRLGEVFKGFRLVSVDESKAVLNSPAGSVTLSLAE